MTSTRTEFPQITKGTPHFAKPKAVLQRSALFVSGSRQIVFIASAAGLLFWSLLLQNIGLCEEMQHILHDNCSFKEYRLSKEIQLLKVDVSL